MTPGLFPAEVWSWWQAQRRRYNRGVLIAAAIAFVLYGGVIELCPDLPEEMEMTAFTVAGQFVAFIGMMAVANVLYCLGPIAETAIRPSNARRFRGRLFGAGYWFSVALPLMPPVLLATGCLVGCWRG